MIKIKGTLGNFLAEQVCQGNSIKETISDGDGTTTVILNGLIDIEARTTAEKALKLKIEKSDNEKYWIAENIGGSDKVLFPCNDGFNLGSWIFKKINLAALVSLITLFAIACTKYWAYQLAKYLDAESLTSLKNYTFSHVSLFLVIYLVGIVLLFLISYSGFLFLNYNNGYVLKKASRSFWSVFKMYAGSFLAILTPWVVIFIAIAIYGKDVLQDNIIFALAFSLISVLACWVGGPLILKCFVPYEEDDIAESYWMSFINNVLGAGVFFAFIFVSSRLVSFPDFGVKLFLFLVMLALAFSAACYMSCFYKAFNHYSKKNKESMGRWRKIKNAVKFFFSLASLILFLTMPILFFLGVSFKHDMFEWSGIGKATKTMIVTPELSKALQMANSYTIGKDVYTDLGYKAKDRTITPWVILNIGERLVLAKSEKAKVKYVFSTNPYKLINIISTPIKQNSNKVAKQK